MEEMAEKLIDITQPFRKPQTFDEVLALTNHYEDMERIIESLQQTKNSCIIIDEDNESKDAESYRLEPEYSTIFIEVLEQKMTEIRKVLGYN